MANIRWWQTRALEARFGYEFRTDLRRLFGLNSLAMTKVAFDAKTGQAPELGTTRHNWDPKHAIDAAASLVYSPESQAASRAIRWSDNKWPRNNPELLAEKLLETAAEEMVYYFDNARRFVPNAAIRVPPESHDSERHFALSRETFAQMGVLLPDEPQMYLGLPPFALPRSRKADRNEPLVGGSRGDRREKRDELQEQRLHDSWAAFEEAQTREVHSAEYNELLAVSLELARQWERGATRKDYQRMVVRGEAQDFSRRRAAIATIAGRAWVRADNLPGTTSAPARAEAFGRAGIIRDRYGIDEMDTATATRINAVLDQLTLTQHQPQSVDDLAIVPKGVLPMPTSTPSFYQSFKIGMKTFAHQNALLKATALVAIATLATVTAVATGGVVFVAASAVAIGGFGLGYSITHPERREQFKTKLGDWEEKREEKKAEKAEKAKVAAKAREVEQEREELRDEIEHLEGVLGAKLHGAAADAEVTDADYQLGRVVAQQFLVGTAQLQPIHLEAYRDALTALCAEDAAEIEDLSQVWGCRKAYGVTTRPTDLASPTDQGTPNFRRFTNWLQYAERVNARTQSPAFQPPAATPTVFTPRVVTAPQAIVPGPVSNPSTGPQAPVARNRAEQELFDAYRRIGLCSVSAPTQDDAMLVGEGVATTNFWVDFQSNVVTETFRSAVKAAAGMAAGGWLPSESEQQAIGYARQLVTEANGGQPRELHADTPVEVAQLIAYQEARPQDFTPPTGNGLTPP